MSEENSRIEREIEILGLKRRAAEAAGSEFSGWQVPDTPIEIEETFWRSVAAYEEADWTTDAELLGKDGVKLPPPEDLDDESVGKALWMLIGALARRQVYLHSTDHMSDRELYIRLYRDALHEAVKDLPRSPNAFRGIDFAGSGSEEDIATWMTYYADNDTRASWLKDFPDYPMPPRKPRPFDRDRHLPQPVIPHFSGFADEDDEGELAGGEGLNHDEFS